MEIKDQPQEEPEGKVWVPTGLAEHRRSGDLPSSTIIDGTPPKGRLASLREYFKRPFVRLVTGLAVFIFAALIYDATINFGSWTERAAPKRATKHKGMDPIKQTPDD